MAPPRKKQRKSLDDTAVQASVAAEAGEQDAGPSATTIKPTTTPTVVDAESASAEAAPVHKAVEKSKRTLYVRSLPPTTTTESLIALFSRSHPVRHATAVLDPANGSCKGFGFVTFADADDANAAKEEFHGLLLNGELGDSAAPAAPQEGERKDVRKKTRLNVEIAEPRKRKVSSKFAADGVELEVESEEAGGDPVTAKKRKRGAADEDEDRLKRDLETGSKVIVRNLPWSIKYGDQLTKHFEKWGKTKDAVMPRKFKGGPLLGFGFITFKSRKAAERAIAEGNGLEIDGRAVAVDWAVQKDAYQQSQGGKRVNGKKQGQLANGNDDESGHDEPAGALVDEDISMASDSEGDGDDSEDNEDEDTDPTDLGSDEDARDEKEEIEANEAEDRSGTLFIRNLPFTCTDEDIEELFKGFGAVRYARVVIDQVTDRSKGTGFVCFYSPDDAEACLRSAPRHTLPAAPSSDKKQSASTVPSILQDESLDPSGKYTLDGRVLHVSRAVAKREASRLTAEGAANRFKRDKDRRRLFLLSEGTINSNTPLYQKLSPAERQLRDASAKQRRSLIESNPSLQISLTRLSIRNLPRSVDGKMLKQLAREGVVGFAKDAKEGKRQRLSKEEISRGGEEMIEAEKERKESKKGIVRQAKIVFESREGGKVDEKSGAGRSRGYGFIEYYTHRNALMGLRWLNGHMVDYTALQSVREKGEKAKIESEDRKKRLIVEFAIENRQVVMRRKEREDKARERGEKVPKDGEDGERRPRGKGGKREERGKGGKREERGKGGKKRKMGDREGEKVVEEKGSDEKLAKKQRIIQMKRMKRRRNKKGLEWKS